MMLQPGNSTDDGHSCVRGECSAYMLRAQPQSGRGFVRPSHATDCLVHVGPGLHGGCGSVPSHFLLEIGANIGLYVLLAVAHVVMLRMWSATLCMGTDHVK